MIPIRLRSAEYLRWSLTIIGSYIPTPPALPPDAAARARTARVERWTRQLSITSAIEHDLVVLGKSKPHIGFFIFSHHISRTQSFRDNLCFITSYFVILNPLVSLISRLVACSPRLDLVTHTNTHTHTQTDQLPSPLAVLRTAEG